VSTFDDDDDDDDDDDGWMFMRAQSRAREEELLQAAESGDVPKLRTLVRGRDFNADYTDQLGRTPLHLAVVNDHKEVKPPPTLPSELLLGAVA